MSTSRGPRPSRCWPRPGRVLKPGGILALDTPNANLTRLQQDAFIDPDHKYEYRHAEMAAMLRGNGFVIERAEGINYGGDSVARGVFDPDRARHQARHLRRHRELLPARLRVPEAAPADGRDVARAGVVERGRDAGHAAAGARPGPAHARHLTRGAADPAEPRCVRLPVDGRHVGVAIALGGGHGVEHGEVLLGELDVERGHVLLQVGAALRARDRRHVAARRVHEGERDLPRRTALGRGELVDDLHDGDVVRQVVALEPGLVAAEVALVQVVERAQGAGEEAAAERAVGDESDAELAQRGQDLLLGITRPHRVLGLQGGDRVHRVRPPDGGRCGLGQAEIAHLALGHELAHRPDRLLNRGVGVDAVLVVEVDVVDAEPLQRAVAGLADVLGAAVDGALGRVVGVAHDAELGGDDRLVAAPGQRLADEHLVGVRPVHVGRVEEVDPELERPVDGGGRLVVVGRTVEVGHPHAAQALARDHESLRSERDRFDGHLGSSRGVRPPLRFRAPGPDPRFRDGVPPYGHDGRLRR